MVTHTAGPWHIDEDTRDGMEWNRHIYAGADNRVCFMSNDEGLGHGLANARLIAAAPDLLDALRMWLDIHETPAGFAGKYGKAFDDALAAQQLKVDAAASAARAAIAKSTGGAA